MLKKKIYDLICGENIEMFQGHIPLKEKGLLDRILIVRNNIYNMCGHSPFSDFSKEVKIKEIRLVLFK